MSDLRDRPMDGEEILPCGCRVGTVDDTFVIIACPKGEECWVVKFAQEETARQGKPSTTLEMP